MLTLSVIRRLTTSLNRLRRTSPILSKLKQIYRVPKLTDLMKWCHDPSVRRPDDPIEPEEVAHLIKLPESYDGDELLLLIADLHESYLLFLSEVIQRSMRTTSDVGKQNAIQMLMAQNDPVGYLAAASFAMNNPFKSDIGISRAAMKLASPARQNYAANILRGIRTKDHYLI